MDHSRYLCLVLVILWRLFIAALWSPEGKGLTCSALVCDVYCEFVTSHLVSWNRCGTCLYRFLIFAVFLTLIQIWPDKAWPRGYKTFFMLHSTEHEISTAHKNKN